MNREIRKLYRQVEDLHFKMPYLSLAKSIDSILVSDMSNEFKLTAIQTFIDDYFEELKDDEEDYL